VYGRGITPLSCTQVAWAGWPLARRYTFQFLEGQAFSAGCGLRPVRPGDGPQRSPETAVMLDGMAANLAPGHAMGMTTVWVRTHYNWSGDGEEDPDHVHHTTEDLTAWLAAIAGAG
jgi:hypothetical protein